MKKMLFVLFLALIFTPLFAEGAMENGEPPLFPANAPFSNEYLKAYEYVTIGFQMDFIELNEKLEMLTEDDDPVAAFNDGYAVLLEKYMMQYNEIEKFGERLASGGFMTNAQKEEFLEAMGNCSNMVLFTASMMSAMLGGGDMEDMDFENMFGNMFEGLFDDLDFDFDFDF